MGVLGSRVQLRFAIGLNIREKELILGLANYFNLHDEVNSNKYIYVSENSVNLQITNFTSWPRSAAAEAEADIINIVIPFFEKYSIYGLKSLDFVDFKHVANLMLNNEHLNSEGAPRRGAPLDKILRIKAGMNRSRLM